MIDSRMACVQKVSWKERRPKTRWHLCLDVKIFPSGIFVWWMRIIPIIWTAYEVNWREIPFVQKSLSCDLKITELQMAESVAQSLHLHSLSINLTHRWSLSFSAHSASICLSLLLLVFIAYLMSFLWLLLAPQLFSNSWRSLKMSTGLRGEVAAARWPNMQGRESLSRAETGACSVICQMYNCGVRHVVMPATHCSCRSTGQSSPCQQSLPHLHEAGDKTNDRGGH